MTGIWLELQFRNEVNVAMVAGGLTLPQGSTLALCVGYQMTALLWDPFHHTHTHTHTQAFFCLLLCAFYWAPTTLTHLSLLQLDPTTGCSKGIALSTLVAHSQTLAGRVWLCETSRSYGSLRTTFP